MPSPARCAHESLAAHLTNERLLARMYPHMLLEVRKASEILFTFAARVPLFAGVSASVALE